jgi:secondary thiamine-phosphate synthase enzyme
MRSCTEYIALHTKKKIEFINITQHVRSIVAKSTIQEGLCLVNAMHITASIFINDEEEGLKKDFLVWLEALAPSDIERYLHNNTGEDNAHAHLKRTIMGREALIAVTKGTLDLGPWESVFYGEFDGQRPKRVLVKVIGE